MDIANRQVTKSHGPPQADWDRLRPVIERLYRNDNKTEVEVRQVLLANYGFSSTPKMFKQHIKKWKLDKKLKRKEMLFAMRKIQQRRVTGKLTRIRVRGVEVPEARILYHFKRRPLSTVEQHDTLSNATTPPDVEYSTPESVEEGEEEIETTISTDEQEKFLSLAPRQPASPTKAVVLIKSSNANHILDRRKVSSSFTFTSTSTPEHDQQQQQQQQLLLQLQAFDEEIPHPQSWSLMYDLNPQEAFLRQLFEHVKLNTGGRLSKLERRTKFDTTSILRASGWFDSPLNDAVEAQNNGQLSQARSIVKRCANTVAAEVEGYFPDMCVLEMVEVVHFLQLRGCQQLQLDFMYNLYDSVSSRLGQFHPLVELLCSATRGYTSTLSATLIPTMLDFLDAHSTDGDVSLNLLLPLFAFQELRSIDTMPHELLIHATTSLRPSTSTNANPNPINNPPHCAKCKAAIARSPFVSTAFRSWAARQFINLLNDIWVEPEPEASAATSTSMSTSTSSATWHAIMRSRVWRYMWKYPHMSARRTALSTLTVRARFWAVAKLCFELVTRNIEKVFVEGHTFFGAEEHVRHLVMQGLRKTDLSEEEIWPLCTEDVQEVSLLDTLGLHRACDGACECPRGSVCVQVQRAVRYWVGEGLCCV